ncbi:permease [Alkaliphilus metalliredigens QYMF]|uniref:Permease n=1 Tax=Alkaliphilus metalliredigens (strain QYMF) TaxID=293826 RepID=A6TMM0_ALKMQ|nr:permease [Alkaliphilus metalliredigens]ABR47438.1 permease [Alkaliphilus metalliredigens QYMF]
MFQRFGHLVAPYVVRFVNWVLQLLGLNIQTGDTFYNAVHFFIYDSIKIIFLLSFMIFVITYIRSYFPPEKVKALLAKFRGIWAYVVASVLGVVSPFCSCSTVPIFIGFVEGGIPLGVTFTFLVTSPIVNEIALGYLFVTFGPKIAILYTLAGMTIGIVTGLLIEKFNLHHLVEEYVYKMKMGEMEAEVMTRKQRLIYAKDSVVDIVKDIWIYVVIGIGIGALIHGWAPEDLLTKYAGPNNPLAVFVGVLFGIPLYANAVGTIPIAEALISKGVGVGTALAFMMSVVALSLPSIILLKKVIKPKLIAIFVGITGAGIVLVGFLFNWIL